MESNSDTIIEVQELRKRLIKATTENIILRNHVAQLEQGVEKLNSLAEYAFNIFAQNVMEFCDRVDADLKAGASCDEALSNARVAMLDRGLGCMAAGHDSFATASPFAPAKDKNEV